MSSTQRYVHSPISFPPETYIRCLDLHQFHKLYVNNASGVMTAIERFLYLDHEELWQPAWGVRTGTSIPSFSSDSSSQSHSTNSYYWPARLLPTEGNCCCGSWCDRIPYGRTQAVSSTVSIHPHSYTTEAHVIHSQLATLDLFSLLQTQHRMSPRPGPGGEYLIRR